MSRFSLLLATLCIVLVSSISRADDWPRWLGPNGDSRWNESGVLTSLPASGPKVLWRAPIAGGYAGPAVAAGKVYLFDFQKQSGEAFNNPGKRAELKGSERLLCIDVATGKQLWKHEYPVTYSLSYPAGPRCTPTVADGRVYILGAEGLLTCLDAQSGKFLWKNDLKQSYHAETPIWGFAGHPLVVGNSLFVTCGGPGSVLVAFNKDSGKELWKATDAKEPGYSPPVLINFGGTQQLLHWNAESINSLDPATGKTYWSIPHQPNYGMAIVPPLLSGDRLFVGGVTDKSLTLKLDSSKPAAEVLWTGSNQTSIGPCHSVPIIDGDYLYGVDNDGELTCVDLNTGKRLWRTLKPVLGDGRPAGSATAFMVKNADHYYLFNELGELVIAQLSPKNYTEVSRAKILQPTSEAFGREVLWSHPAFAGKTMFARNDKELIAVSLAK